MPKYDIRKKIGFGDVPDVDIERALQSLDSFDPRAQSIMRKRMSGMLLKDIARETPPRVAETGSHISAERVRQIEARSIRQMRGYLRRNT